MKAYKLTDGNCKTYGDTPWGENVTHTASGAGELCKSGWIHFYIDPRLAVILNPVHRNFKNSVLWEAEADGKFKHNGQLKSGCTKLTTIRRIPLPEISLEKKIEFGIRCALKVYKDGGFVKWAEDWLSGVNRTSRAAEAAWAAARAAWAAAWAAWAAETAARAAWAAEAAEAAARAAWAAWAAWAAARAAWAAEAEAAAAWAAWAADIDLLAVLDKCGICAVEV